MRLGILLALALLLLAPLASAASVAGALRFREGADVRGDVAVEAATGALDVSAAQPVLRFERAEGWLVTRAWEFVGPAGGPQAYRGAGEPRNESISLAAGTLDGLVCAPAQCRAVLVADGAGALRLAGAAEGPLRLRESAGSFYSGVDEPGVRDTFHYGMDAGWLAASTRPGATTLAGAQPGASGALTLFLVNATLDATTASGMRTIDTMPRSEPTTSGPLTTGSRAEVRFAVLRLHGAQLVEAPGDVDLFAPAPRVQLDGALHAAAAEGRLVVDGRARELRGESLRLEGALALAPAGEAALVPLAPLVLASTVEGEADVRVGGAAVGSPLSRPIVAVAVSAGAVAAVVAAALFYTRLERGSLLENPRRRAIHDHVKGRPGSTVADMVRELRITEVVVRHHLRVLEDHQLVVVRGEGKLRAYFALDGATDAARMHLHVALKDPTRRRVAEAVAAAPAPMSQKDLVAAVGLSQRLVSYHLAKLEEQGLVSGSGAMPRRYLASAALAEFLAPADAVAA